MPDAYAQPFQEAAELRGLLETTAEHYDAFTDIVARAAEYQSASGLRMLFAHLLLHCSLADPAQLWESFLDAFTDDLHIVRDSGRVRDLALLDVQRHLTAAGKRLSDFGLAEPDAFDLDAFRHAGHASRGEL